MVYNNESCEYIELSEVAKPSVAKPKASTQASSTQTAEKANALAKFRIYYNYYLLRSQDSVPVHDQAHNENSSIDIVACSFDYVIACFKEAFAYGATCDEVMLCMERVHKQQVNQVTPAFEKRQQAFIDFIKYTPEDFFAGIEGGKLLCYNIIKNVAGQWKTSQFTCFKLGLGNKEDNVLQKLLVMYEKAGGKIDDVRVWVPFYLCRAVTNNKQASVVAQEIQPRDNDIFGFSLWQKSLDVFEASDEADEEKTITLEKRVPDEDILGLSLLRLNN